MVNKTQRSAVKAVLFMSVTSIVTTLVLSFMYLSATVGWVANYVPEGMKALPIFAVDARTVSSPFLYTFGSDGTLNEAGSLDTSSSPYFWLNSGGMLTISDGVGKTVHGALPRGSFWQTLYARTSSVDTGGGYYPQNLFRFITRSAWKNLSEEVKFKITKLNETDTTNRGGYSGILMLSRYKDSDNLYYAGIRQDGTAVIKKKLNGKYYTIAQAAIPGYTPSDYDRETNPNLLPTGKWMRLKTETVTNANGSVQISVYLDENNDGTYAKILTGTDSAGKFGSAVIDTAASAGIRADYFDMQFDDYLIKTI